MAHPGTGVGASWRNRPQDTDDTAPACIMARSLHGADDQTEDAVGVPIADCGGDAAALQEPEALQAAVGSPCRRRLVRHANS